MAGTSFAETEKNLDLRLQALEANKEVLPHMEVPRQRGAVILTEMKELRVKQASLTADKQSVSKRLAVLNGEAQILMTSMDAAIRAQYGTRSEKLVEFGRKPFRSQPRVKLVLVDEKGQPVKPGSLPAAPVEPPAPSLKE
jgi:hypothetical protein